ncbi:LysM domain / Lipoprotein NlpD [Mycetocola reblochoni REB411]|uniref:LysM domain / Lipoprotein NlpD n=1 Tax=Mycetocola reblochoni REB411 TaxID=1255698 RepID=A0A1R4JZR7_9MICO|nr:LysM domain / Lipoprotein NlpD [Mycetocola reblochoni REB411]
MVPETTRVVFPLPEGSWVRTSPFGWRTDPITFETAFHSGSDFAAADGTPIYAVADGIVTHAGYTGNWGGLIILEHTVSGERVASYYAHMWEYGIHVTEGMTVTAGQHIGDVGSSGKSTGPHLHLEIRPGGQGQPAIDSDQWLTDQGAEGIAGGNASRASCTLGGGGR